MADENNQISDLRRARINRIKKSILVILAVLIIIPIILCIILSVKVCSLENQLDDLLAMKNDGRLTVITAANGSKRLLINNQSVQTQINQNEETEADVDYITGNEEYTTTESQNESDNGCDKETAIVVEADTTEGTSEKEITQNSSDKRGEGKTVCLTFDDGPSGNTEKIIDILNHYGVKATFFVVGKEDEESLKRYKMIVDNGNTIALHSYSHDYSKVYNSIDDFVSELEKIRKLVYEATGVDTKIFRFPGGSANSTITKMDIHECIDYLNENGYTYYDWNVSSGDASPTLQTVEQIMSNIENDLFKMNTAIILMHDAENKTTTVEALPQLIEMLLQEGFEIKAIDDSIPTIQQIKYQ